MTGFSVLLVYLIVRLIREHRQGQQAWATLGGSPLVRFRYDRDQWRRLLRLEAARHARFAAACTVIGVVGLLAVFFGMACFVEPSLLAFAKKEGGWLTEASVALSLGVGAFIFTQRAGSEHLLRWLITPPSRADVSIFSTGLVIAGAALPWSTPTDSLLSINRDLLVLELEKLEPQESGGENWVPRTLRLPVPRELDVSPVIAGVVLSPRHRDDNSKRRGSSRA